MFVSHGNIFCNGNKNATSLYETAFLIGVSIFSVNRKRIVLLTLFCLLKNRNNGNFTVPIHKIPVMALLIIRIINFRFRFKRGTVCHVFVKGRRKNLMSRCSNSSPRYSVRTTMLSLLILKISYVLNNKISITLLSFLICLGKELSPIRYKNNQKFR